MGNASCGECELEGLTDDFPRTPCPRCGSLARAIEAGIEETAQATDEYSAAVRHNFALVHLLSAASFSRRLQVLEAEHAGKAWGPFCDDLLASASAAVMLVAAGLEAYVNEFCLDHTELFSADRADGHEARMAWRRKALLEKYEYALELLGCATLDRGSRVYQNVKALASLRNALTHFKPEWDTEQHYHAQVSQLLRGKIDRSPFLPPTEPLFPLGWASHSCTAWAVRSASEFLQEFERTASVGSRLESFTDRLADL